MDEKEEGPKGLYQLLIVHKNKYMLSVKRLPLEEVKIVRDAYSEYKCPLCVKTHGKDRVLWIGDMDTELVVVPLSEICSIKVQPMGKEEQ